MTTPYFRTTYVRRGKINKVHRHDCTNVPRSAPRIGLHQITDHTSQHPQDWLSWRQCPCLTPADLPIVRAQLWLNHMRGAVADAQRKAAERVARAEYIVKRDAWLAQFQPLVASVASVWTNGASIKSWMWDGNLALELNSESGFSRATIYLQADHGAPLLRVTGVNHSTGLIQNAADAKALAQVFDIAENYLFPNGIDVPADAPRFAA